MVADPRKKLTFPCEKKETYDHHIVNTDYSLPHTIVAKDRWFITLSVYLLLNAVECPDETDKWTAKSCWLRNWGLDSLEGKTA